MTAPRVERQGKAVGPPTGGFAVSDYPAALSRPPSSGNLILIINFDSRAVGAWNVPPERSPVPTCLGLGRVNLRPGLLARWNDCQIAEFSV
jgi:hypothetical protein